MLYSSLLKIFCPFLNCCRRGSIMRSGWDTLVSGAERGGSGPISLKPPPFRERRKLMRAGYRIWQSHPLRGPRGWGPKRLIASRPSIRASISRRLRSRSNAQRKASDSRFVGIRRLRAGGEPAFALRTGRQATGTVRRCNGGSANAGQRGQRKGQRALSASIAPRPP